VKRLTIFLDLLAKQFPSSKWDVYEGEGFEGAVLEIDPLAAKLVLFTAPKAHFQKGDVTLSLHAGPHLLRMYGTPTVLHGKATHVCRSKKQFEAAARLLCDDLLGTATAIFAVTEEPVEDPVEPLQVEVPQKAPESCGTAAKPEDYSDDRLMSVLAEIYR